VKRIHACVFVRVQHLISLCVYVRLFISACRAPPPTAKTPGFLPRMGLTVSHLQVCRQRFQKLKKLLALFPAGGMSQHHDGEVGWRSSGWRGSSQLPPCPSLSRLNKGGNVVGVLENPAFSHSIPSLVEVWLEKKSLDGSQNTFLLNHTHES